MKMSDEMKMQVFTMLFGDSADSDPVGNDPIQDRGIQIVALQRGWVVVGRVSVEGDQITIAEAKIIRRWGTTKGLGQLISGPIADKTVLDDGGIIRAHVLGVVFTLDCDAKGWEDHLCKCN